MALGDGFDNAACASLMGELARRPMTDRAPRRLGGLTGQGDDLAPLFRATGGRGARTRSVLEPLGDRAAVALEPMATPASDGGARRPEAPGHIGGCQALRQQEDDVSAEAQVLGRLMGTYHRVKRVALLLGKRHGRRLGARHRRLLYSAGSVV